MASLSSCLSKFGKAIPKGDQDDVRSKQQALMADGVAAPEAAAQAIEAVIADAEGDLQQVVEAAAAKGVEVTMEWGTAPEAAAAPVEAAKPEAPKQRTLFSRAADLASDAFRNWFGKSKVVGPDGKPLVVYHGTAEEFWAFQQGIGKGADHATSPLGFYFTPNRAQAQHYARNASDGRPADERVIDAYLSIQNPYTMTIAQAQAIKTQAEAKALRAKLEAQGYDGIRMEGPNGGSWIAFESGQAKSASVRKGPHDRANPDMRYSRTEAKPQPKPAEEPAKAVGVTTQQAESIARDAWGSGFIGRLMRSGVLNFITSSDAAKLGISGLNSVADVLGNNVKGIYYNGKAYVVADNTPAEEIAGIILHEVGEHAGMKKMLGDADYKRLMDFLQREAKRDKDVKAARDRVPGDTHPDDTWTEALAYLLEASPGHGITQRVVDGLRTAFNRMGIPARLLAPKSTADLLRWVGRESLRNMARGGATVVFKGNGRRLFHRAWHGSPHNHDKFDSRFIGTGEGGAAYGHGHYFAGARQVAEFYRNALVRDPRDDLQAQINSMVANNAVTRDNAAYAVDEVPELDNLDDFDRRLLIDAVREAAEGTAADGTVSPAALAAFRKIDKIMPPKGKGALYEVELAPNEDEYLQWDEPLSEQSGTMRSKLIAVKSLIDYDKNDSGMDVYRRLSDKLLSQEEASKKLRSIGIPGIRYKDGSSRGKEGGTYNYVIFDDNLIDIRAKYSRATFTGQDREPPKAPKPESPRKALRQNEREWVQPLREKEGKERAKFSKAADTNSNFDQPKSASFTESDYRPTVVSWAKDRWGDEVAPNGNPIWQNFVRWFGDSAAVDEDGKPVVAFHGTRADIAAFRPGSWFADNPAFAETFFNGRFGIVRKGSRKTYPAFLSVANPLRFKNYVTDIVRAADVAKALGMTEREFTDALVEKEKASTAKDVAAIRERGGPDLSDRMPAHYDGFGRASNMSTTTDGSTSAPLWTLLDQGSFVDLASERGFDGIDTVEYARENGGKKYITSRTWMAFRPEQIKSATGNTGDFDAAKTDIRFSKGPARTPEQAAAMQKASIGPDMRSRWGKLRDRVMAIVERMRWSEQRKHEAIQSTLDRFHGLKLAEQAKGGIAPEASSYVSARLTTGLPSIMEALMRFGALEWRDGILSVKAGTKGLLDALEPVQDDIEGWLGWMIGRRAERLEAQGRENLMSQDDIDALLSLNKGKEKEFQQAADDYEAIKSAVLDLAEKAGVIDPVARAAWDHAEYIPFYRVDDGGNPLKPGKQHGIQGQASGIRTLKGGESRIADPMSNILTNFTKLIDASLKNNAMLEAHRNLGDEYFRKVGPEGKPAVIPMTQVVKTLLAEGVPQSVISSMPPSALIGVRRMMSLVPPTGDNVVSLLRDGKREYYEVDDPLLLRALTAFKPITSFPAILPLKFLKRFLTASVTADPAFMARNFLRDSGSSYVISDDHFLPVWDSVRGLGKSFAKKGGMVDMMAAGGSFVGGYVNGGDPAETAKTIRRVLRARGMKAGDIDAFMDTVAKGPKWLWDKWQEFGSAIENANREAVFEAAIKNGRSRKEAVFLAKDLMDFSMQGDSQFMAMFTDTIPFLNARLQGLYKLQRSGAIPGRRMRAAVAMRGGMIAMLSVGLAVWNAMMHGDAWDELPEYEKDTFWHIAPGTPYHTRIPKPFEIGLIYGSIPERIFRAVQGSKTNYKSGDTPGDSLRAIGSMLVNTLAINPIPQGFMPLAELWANKDTFTQRPIEDIGDKALLPEARAEWFTSDIAKRISAMMPANLGMSPKRIQHLWEGYTGTLGTYVMGISDAVTRELADDPKRPSWQLRDWPVIGTFARGGEPPRNTRSMTEFYRLFDEVNKISNTIKAYRVSGDPELIRRAQVLQTKHANLLGEEVESKRAKAGIMFTRVKEMNQLRDRLGELRKEAEAVIENESITPDDKRHSLDLIAERRNKLVRDMVQSLRERH